MGTKKLQLNYPIRIKEEIAAFTQELFYFLFDNQNESAEELKQKFCTFSSRMELNCCDLWEPFLVELPNIIHDLQLDAEAIEANDPAAKSIDEVYLAYPGFYAIAIYRLAHALLNLGVKTLPRVMSEYAHSVTGVDINPSAQIGKSFFIDHATGIVVGETVTIGDNVKIYQGVTLGAWHVHKAMQSVKRHPTIKNGVTIYANATVLGGDTIVGEGSTIGANVWLTESVPPHSRVYQKSKPIISPDNKKTHANITE